MTLPFPELEHVPANRIAGFYNTTNETGDSLVNARAGAASQQELILRFFDVTQKEYTPSQVSVIFGNRWPVTSVRRAMTNLTKEGRLVRTDNKKRGPYGRNEYTWRVA